MVAGFDIRQRPAATVRFAGIPGFQSVAQRWTNLVDRVEISPNIAPTNGRFNYTDNSSDWGTLPSPAYPRLMRSGN